MPANPNGFDHLRRGELVPYAQGIRTTFGFDYFRRGELVQGMIDVAAPPPLTRRAPGILAVSSDRARYVAVHDL
jgi:hypothetical protein